MKFVVSKRARRHIEKIQAWWVENRPAAPALFLDDLAGAERRLRTTPTLGVIYSAHKSGVVRRVLLEETHHHLFYRYVTHQPSRDDNRGSSRQVRAPEVGNGGTKNHRQGGSAALLGGSAT